MKNKKIVAMLLAIVLVIAMTTVLLVACQTPITAEEGYTMLQAALEKSINAGEYFTKIDYVKGKFSQTLSLQYIPDNEKTNEINETKIKFVDDTSHNPLENNITNNKYFGYSKSKSIETKNATAADYLPYQFIRNNGQKNATATATTETDFWETSISGIMNEYTGQTDSVIKIKDLQISNLFGDLGEIEFDNITVPENGMTSSGPTQLLNFSVNQEGNSFNGLTLYIEIVNGKINRIKYGRGEVKITLDFVYTSPKMTTPDYDA